MAFWVRCGTSLYRFLIFTYFTFYSIYCNSRNNFAYFKGYVMLRKNNYGDFCQFTKSDMGNLSVFFKECGNW